MIVIKVGGSLSRTKKLKDIGKIIRKCHNIVIVPGGGEFADVVRSFDRYHKLDATTSHFMAIAAMDLYGMFLSSIFYIPSCDSLDQAKMMDKSVILPYKLMRDTDPLKHSWDVTSDSIAAHIAVALGAEKLILLKEVDGVFGYYAKGDGKQNLIKEISLTELSKMKSSPVDKFFAKIMQNSRIECYITNGRFPERLRMVLADIKTVSTRISTI